MNFLYPFLLAGLAAVAIPIALHMIRRHTKERRAFSSLMFLKPSTPRFRRRSKLEHLALLLLRCAVIALLALALARPFWIEAQATGVTPVTQRRVILLDVSASMRRADLWTQARARVREALQEAGPGDRVCVMAFDRDVRTLIDFDQWQRLGLPQGRSAVEDRLAALTPGWQATDLGTALMTAAEALEDDRVGSESLGVGLRQIICVSDVQQGASLTALQSYQWPAEVQVRFQTVEASQPTNASLQWVADRNDAGSGAVRITNSPDATQERFTLHGGTDANQVRDVYVPAGFRVLVTGDLVSPEAGVVRLSGDDHDFDNTLYVAPHVTPTTRIRYWGPDDGTDPQGLRFYLQQALAGASGRTFALVDDDAGHADLLVVAQPLDDSALKQVSRELQAGTPVWVVLTSADMEPTLAELSSTEVTVSEAPVGDYAMLGQLNMDHPAMMPFADPRFGNFTRLHLWHHRQVALGQGDDLEVMARFESQEPAWWTQPVGQGVLLVMAHGWHPSDSDLALSSKFIPLLYSCMDYLGLLHEPVAQVEVGDVIELDPTVQVIQPDGTQVTGVEALRTAMPGLYRLQSGSETRTVAVNLGATEGRTAPCDWDALAQVGLPIESSSPVAALPSYRQEQRSFAAMEQQQKLWRVLLVTALVLLVTEVWLAGLLTRPQGASS